jgi:hypothetical protein
VNIQSIQSLGREPKSASLVVILMSEKCLLLSLYPVNNSADKNRLWDTCTTLLTSSLVLSPLCST